MDNEFPILVGLDKNDELYDVKKEIFLKGIEDTVTEYRIVGNLKS